ncbi:hypothetical protein SAMN05877753_11128 [Bacillus oleivorans]|uniref:DUF2281 domain-containing protein n=1 Tax=Bacillus oleivorans TaxID=1448271 RepID=A0A285D5R1_9BACI|nr:hypothetical protein [Bacillus oleivorans]SNX75142.1 hypothetical protein SAMN05877753_11128 [Bacillus oleivorans]
MSNNLWNIMEEIFKLAKRNQEFLRLYDQLPDDAIKSVLDFIEYLSSKDQLSIKQREHESLTVVENGIMDSRNL